MIGLLTQRFDHTPKMAHYKINYATKLITDYLDTIQNYYRNSGFYVKRPNMLVTLISALDINIHDSKDSVKFAMQDKYSRIANTIGINTGIDFNSEPFLDTVFEGVNEFFILTEDSDVVLECIYSTLNTLFLTHPKRFEKEFDADDYNIYSINIVNLALAYHAWANKEMEDYPDAYSIDPAKFIYEEVLTDLIPSIFKQAIFNRYYSIYNNKDIDEFKNFNPFFVKNIDPLITSVQSWYIDEILKNDSKSYQELLITLPDFNNGNMLDAYHIPNIYFGSKGEWLLLLARISYFSFLLDIGDRRLDKQYINELKIWLGLAKRKRYFDIYNLNIKYILNIKLKLIKEKI